MQQVGMGSPDPPRDSFERDRLRTHLDQQFARGTDRRGAAFIGGQAFSY